MTASPAYRGPGSPYEWVRTRIVGEVMRALAKRPGRDVAGWIPGEVVTLSMAGFEVWPSRTVWKDEPVDLTPPSQAAPDVEGWWWYDTDEPDAPPIFVAGPVSEPPVPSDEIVRLCVDGRR